MRYLILSDIHSNLAALEAVLAAAPNDTWDQLLVLGDIVGYGSEPNEVIDRIRALDPMEIIRGNHDKAACGIDDASNFNQVARLAAEWTARILTPENEAYLHQLPNGPIAIDDMIEICHGSPFDEDQYIFDAGDAQLALAATTRPLCLFGHTHQPVVFRLRGESFEARVPDGEEDERLAVDPAGRYLVNPGSVGQPRDGDPRAAFALYDGETSSLYLRRVPYEVGETQRRIIAAGLPVSLANRLAIGR